MKLIRATLVLLACAAVSAVSAQTPELWSISRTDNFLRRIDPSDGSTLDAVFLSLPGELLDGARGLAWDPVGGRLFALAKISGNPHLELVTVDMTTGILTSVGSTGDGFATIAFDESGTLYGVTGDGASVPEALHTLSTVNATPTFLTFLGDGNDGEALGYNPDDGLLYHASGEGFPNFDEIFQSVDPSSLAVVDIFLWGDDYETALALAYEGGDSFLLVDLFENLYRVATDGTVSFIANVGHGSKGLAFVPTQRARLSVSPDDNLLRQIDASDGSTVDSVPLTLSGSTVTGATGLAWNPVEGRLYALLTLGGQPGRELATISLPGGSCTSVGDTGDQFAGIAFDSAGSLYGVTDDGALTPEALFSVSTSDGTPTLLRSLGDGSDGEALAFSPDDGALYHASGRGVPNVDEILEAVDPIGLGDVDVPLSGDDYDEAMALAYEGSDTLLLADLAGVLYRASTSGVVDSAGALDHVSKGLAVASSSDCTMLDPLDVVGPPKEVAGLAVGAGVSTLTWQDQGIGIRYDVVGGDLADLHLDAGVDGAACLENDTGSPSFADPRPVPVAGSGYYYLVRAQNPCASGTYGSDSAGGERAPSSGCP